MSSHGSARDPEPHHLTVGLLADAESAHRWRTQRLFDLAVTASSTDPRRVARAIGIDFRSLAEMREVPSLRYIARIAQVLGIDPSSAAEVVGVDGSTHPERGATIDTLIALAAAADLDDDAVALDRLASAIAIAAREPGDLALSVLCGARADAARGEVRDARRRACFAEEIASRHASGEAAAVAADMRACLGFESMLGEPWAPLGEIEPPARGGPRSAEPSFQRGLDLAAPVAARARAFALAIELMHASVSDDGRASDVIASLRRHLCDVQDRGCVRALAWAASIAGIAALRALEREALPVRARRSAMSLFVGAQLAIDERIARDGGAQAEPSMALLRRRLRLSLHEWCDRARRGETGDALLDEFDNSEVRTMFVRFPRARGIDSASPPR